MFSNQSKSICIILVFLSINSTALGQWTILSKTYPNLDISDVCVHEGRIIAVGTAFNNFTGHIFTSNDDGKSWDTVQISPPGYFLKTISFKDKDTGFIGGYGSVSLWLRTTDGGLHWDFYNSDYVNSGISDMQFLNSKVGFACGYGAKQFLSGNVYKTTDGGINWIPQTDPMDSLPIDGMQMINEKYGYAWGGIFGFRTLLRTVDSGITWQKYYKHNAIPGGMFWWNENEGILVDASGAINKTYNAGKDWKNIKSPVSGSVQLSTVSFIDEKTGFIAGTNGIILKSVDKGETWTKEISHTTRFLDRVKFCDNRAYITGADGMIMRSEFIASEKRITLTAKVTVFPNPVHDFLYFSEVPLNVKIRITDISGKQVMDFNLGFYSNSIDLSNLQSGLYWVMAEGVAPVKISKL